MLLGIFIGVGIMVLIILAFALGYGIADQRHSTENTENDV